MRDRSTTQPNPRRRGEPWLRVSVADQTITLINGDDEIESVWPVSTAARGLGEMNNSLQTPRGWHQIRACIGAGVPENGVFQGRRFRGEIYGPALAHHYPDRDWILTRILWLSGLEPGFNRRGDCDTMRRYIYIHGTPESNPLGVALSHGCVRMHNAALLELFNRVRPGTRICICET
jgi:hypothetical protein